MSLEIPKSNFYFVEQNFADIIEEVRDGVGGLKSDSKSARKTIVFRDMSKMHCIEELDRMGYIELYWYDWYDSDKQIIMKFHAHYHQDGTPVRITKYDPFHIHNHADGRLVNEKFRELNDILEFIRIRQFSLKEK